MDNPEPIASSIDTLVSQLASPESLLNGLDWMCNRQSELYEKSRQLTQAGQRLSTEETAELDDIHTALLEIQHINDRYNPPQ